MANDQAMTMEERHIYRTLAQKVEKRLEKLTLLNLKISFVSEQLHDALKGSEMFHDRVHIKKLTRKIKYLTEKSKILETGYRKRLDSMSSYLEEVQLRKRTRPNSPRPGVNNRKDN